MSKMRYVGLMCALLTACSSSTLRGDVDGTPSSQTPSLDSGVLVAPDAQVDASTCEPTLDTCPADPALAMRALLDLATVADGAYFIAGDDRAFLFTDGFHWGFAFFEPRNVSLGTDPWRLDFLINLGDLVPTDIAYESAQDGSLGQIHVLVCAGGDHNCAVYTSNLDSTQADGSEVSIERLPPELVATGIVTRDDVFGPDVCVYGNGIRCRSAGWDTELLALENEHIVDVDFGAGHAAAATDVGSEYTSNHGGLGDWESWYLRFESLESNPRKVAVSGDRTLLLGSSTLWIDDAQRRYTDVCDASLELAYVGTRDGLAGLAFDTDYTLVTTDGTVLSHKQDTPDLTLCKSDRIYDGPVLGGTMVRCGFSDNLLVRTRTKIYGQTFCIDSIE
jgi:hypothetical protein